MHRGRYADGQPKQLRIGDSRPRLGGCALAELGSLFCDEQNPKRTWRTIAGQSFHDDQFGVSETVVKPRHTARSQGRWRRSPRFLQEKEAEFGNTPAEVGEVALPSVNLTCVGSGCF